MDVPAITTIVIGLVAAAAAAGSFVVNYIHLRRIRAEDNSTITSAMFSDSELPKIHATSGVPTLEQLTRKTGLRPKQRRLARFLYNIGLDQYNHYVNNRDGIIAESRTAMVELRGQMSPTKVKLAEKVGIALTKFEGDSQRNAKIQFDDLDPQEQIYAQHKRREHEALTTIAVDLGFDVPRTDYTSVRSLIEAGEVSHDAIISELPYPWQELSTLNESYAGKRPSIKPPRREFIHLMIMTQENTYLEDERAERIDKWIHSGKFGFYVPYKEPTQVLEADDLAGPYAPTGEFVTVITEKMGSEWITEYWRNGGFADQQLRLAREGMLPEQLRQAYRWRLFSIGIRVLAAVLVSVDVVLLIALFLF